MKNNTMFSRLPTHLLIAAAALLAALCLAPATASAHNHEGDEKESELYKKMEEMQDHYRSLGRGLRRPSAEDLPGFLDNVQQLQVLTVQTKTMIPSMASSVPEEERPTFVLAYRQKQLDTLRSLIDLEEALLEADFEKADELFDEVKKHRSEGHESFKQDD